MACDEGYTAVGRHAVVVVVVVVVGKQGLFQSKEWQEVFSPMTPLYWLRQALR